MVAPGCRRMSRGYLTTQAYFGRAIPLSLLGTYSSAYPLTGYIATSAEQPPLSYLLTAVNPFPGSFTTGGDPVQSTVEHYTPFNALGELALYGMPALVRVLRDRWVRSDASSNPGRQARWRTKSRRAPCVGASLSLFSVSILQYNLRSSTRLLWYAAVIVAVLLLTHRLNPTRTGCASTNRSGTRET